MAVHEYGEVAFPELDESNIPVNINIHLNEEQEGDFDYPSSLPPIATLKWVATANCFQPRKNYVEEGALKAASNDRDELVAYVQRYTIPLYKKALEAIGNLGKADENGHSYFRYWDVH